MAIKAKHKDTTFGVGDRVKVTQKIKEGEKMRLQVFDGIVIGIRGEGENKSFTVRRIGVQQIGIERIYPLISPSIEKVEVVRPGTKGIRRAKLYYIRDKSKKEIELIYSRVSGKDLVQKKKRKTKTDILDKKRKSKISSKNAQKKRK
jgi:large subunit ribosomal protein L19